MQTALDGAGSGDYRLSRIKEGCPPERWLARVALLHACGSISDICLPQGEVETNSRAFQLQEEEVSHLLCLHLTVKRVAIVSLMRTAPVCRFLVVLSPAESSFAQDQIGDVTCVKPSVPRASDLHRRRCAVAS